MSNVINFNEFYDPRIDELKASVRRHPATHPLGVKATGREAHIVLVREGYRPPKVAGVTVIGIPEVLPDGPLVAPEEPVEYEPDPAA